MNQLNQADKRFTNLCLKSCAILLTNQTKKTHFIPFPFYFVPNAKRFQYLIVVAFGFITSYIVSVYE